MVTEAQLDRSKAIQRRTGRTFHIATRLLPARVRLPTYVLYAFFRIADDVVDDPNPPPPARQRWLLERMRDGALGDRDARRELRRTDRADAAEVLAAFDDLRRDTGIDDAEVDAFIESMLADIDSDAYDDHGDLATYLSGSAVAVGNMMLSVMDPPEAEQARPHARALAEAFQVTNFLRDVREDVREYDRVYLPEAALAEHGCTPADVRRLEPTPALQRTIRDELRWTEEKYREGVAGIAYLPPDCRLAVLLSAVLYAEHHRAIRANAYDVFCTRPSLSIVRQLALAARTWVAWQRTGDAEAVFYRVSAIDPEPDPVAGDLSEAGSQPSRATAPVRTVLGRLWRGRVPPWGSDR